MAVKEMSDNKFNWYTFFNIGLFGGAAAVYVSAIGMVETFAQRNLLGTFINLGTVLLLTGALTTGFFVARSILKGTVSFRFRPELLLFSSIGVDIKLQEDEKQQERTQAIAWRILAAAAFAGFIASLPNIFLIILASTINLRTIFVNISPALVELITFNNGLVLGSLIFVVASILVSIFAAVLYVLPGRVQLPVAGGLLAVLIFGLFANPISQVLTTTFNLGGINLGRTVVRLFYRSESLIPVTAVLLFVIVAGITYFRRTRIASGHVQPKEMSASDQKNTRWAMLLAVIVLVLVLPFLVGSFLSHVLFLVGLYILMGLGLNIVVGFAGLLDLGYVAFFAFGAYTMGVLTSSTELGVGGFSFWLALPICVVVAVFFGILLGFPVLRMRGDYLAITTLGFGEIIRILAISDWLKPSFGGAQGVLGIASPTIGPIVFNTPQAMYYVVVLGALLAGFITIRLRNSRLGRQWMAMREDEDVAEAMGINLVSTKLMAFAIGAGFSGLSGAIFASRVGTIFPNSFGLLISINVLAVIIVGGMGSIPGVIIGSFILVGMPELLREFAEYRLLMYGILLIVMMLTRPEGFIPAETIKRELHADEDMEGPSDVEVPISADMPQEPSGA